MGRSGKFFAYQHFGVLPDVVMSAKALGCGVSVGAFALSEKVADKSLDFGEHGTTYGGNPLACAAVNAVFSIFEQEKVVQNVANLTPYLEKALDELVKEFKFIKKRSGLGFMQGLSVDESVKTGDIIKEAQKNALIIISCGTNDLRFLPPLIITQKHIDEMQEKLRQSLKKFA